MVVLLSILIVAGAEPLGSFICNPPPRHQTTVPEDYSGCEKGIRDLPVRRCSGWSPNPRRVGFLPGNQPTKQVHPGSPFEPYTAGAPPAHAQEAAAVVPGPPLQPARGRWYHKPAVCLGVPGPNLLVLGPQG